MQLMPDTARWAAELMGLEDFDIEQLFDPEINIAIGVWYLSTLRQQFDGDTILALAAYNGGRANVLRWLREEAWSGEVETISDIPFFPKRGATCKRCFTPTSGTGASTTRLLALVPLEMTRVPPGGSPLQIERNQVAVDEDYTRFHVRMTCVTCRVSSAGLRSLEGSLRGGWLAVDKERANPQPGPKRPVFAGRGDRRTGGDDPSIRPYDPLRSPYLPYAAAPPLRPDDGAPLGCQCDRGPGRPRPYRCSQPCRKPRRRASGSSGQGDQPKLLRSWASPPTSRFSK